MITVNINQEQYQFNKGISLAEVINHLGIPQEGIAVAIDNEVVPKATWKNTLLEGNENIIIITATQGG